MNQSEMIKALKLIRFHLGTLDEVWIDNLSTNDEANMIIGKNIKEMSILLNECLKKDE